MSEKVLKVLIKRVEESAVYYNIHKNENWLELLENGQRAILKLFKEQREEIERLKTVEQAYEALKKAL